MTIQRIQIYENSYLLYKNEQTTQTNTITQLNAILTNINEITSDTSGLVPKLLEDENAKGSIANVLLPS